MGDSTSKTTTNNTSTQQALPEQQGYLSSGWQDAQNILNERNAAGPYSGNFVATDASGQQANTNTAALNWANSTGQGISNTQQGAATGQLATGTAAQANAITNLTASAAANTPAAQQAAAAAYANGQNIGAATTAATQQAYQDAANNTLPSIYRNAASSGSLNSDRTALAQGLVQQGLAQTSANTYANLWNQAYNTGGTNYSTQNAANNAATTAAGTLGSTAASQGYTGLNNAYTTGATSNQLAVGAANNLNSLDQATLDNQLKQWASNYSYDQNNLNDYWNVVSPLKGGTTTSAGTSTTDTSPSLASQIGQGIGTAGSLMKLFGG